jgi:hypothetical protein
VQVNNSLGVALKAIIDHSIIYCFVFAVEEVVVFQNEPAVVPVFSLGS